MTDANPNVALIKAIAAAKTTHDIMGLLDGATLVEFASDAVEYIVEGDYKDNIEKACILEFCTRHGGVTMSNVRRFSPVLAQRTNRCGTCREFGHNANHCPGRGAIR